MIGFALRRLAQLVPVVLIASIGVWGMIYAVPGGPVGALVGEDATARADPRGDAATRPGSAGARAICELAQRGAAR